MFGDYHLFIKGTVLTIMKTLLQVLLFTLGSVTYASAETNIKCTWNGNSNSFIIDDKKQEIRQVAEEDVTGRPPNIILFHEDFIIFEIRVLGKPYTAVPDKLSLDGSFIIYNHVINRLTGKMDKVMFLKTKYRKDVAVSHSEWDCAVQGKQF